MNGDLCDLGQGWIVRVVVCELGLGGCGLCDLGLLCGTVGKRGTTYLLQ